MPKIKIEEIDNTASVQLDSVSNVVFIPGLSATEENVQPKLFLSAYSFKEDSDNYVKDGSFKLAKRLLQLGMQVLFAGVKASETTAEEQSYITKIKEESVSQESSVEYFTVSGFSTKFYFDENNTITYEVPGTGSGEEPIVETVSIVDGVATFTGMSYIIKKATIDYVDKKVVYVRDVIVSGTIDTTELNKLFKNVLTDVNTYNIRFLTTGAYAVQSHELISCATRRGDCVALIDHSKTSTTVDSVRNEIESLVGEGSEYCTAFTPWLKLKLEETEPVIELPGSAGYLLAYARSVQSNPSWYAMAGSSRGVISELIEPNVHYSKAECEMFQARAVDEEVSLDGVGDNIGIAINPIAEINPFGVVVWGNRTLLKNNITSASESLKATAFLNVRNIISSIKKELYATALKYTFEQNSEVLWVNFKSRVTPLLDKMQSGNGIEGYKLIRQATPARARLKAKVVIVPIEAVEDFELTVSLEDSLEVVE